MSTLPRFYVREHSGHLGMMCGGHANPHTGVMVIDRDYCHRVVRSYNSAAEVKPWQNAHYREEGWLSNLEARRRVAAERCAALNLEVAREPVSC